METGSYYSFEDTERVAITNDFIYKHPNTVWAKLHRRSIIERYHLRFPVDCIHEDEFFHILYLAHARNAAKTSERLYCYRTRPGSIMNTEGKVCLFELLPLFMELSYTHYKETGVLEQRRSVLRDFLVHKGYTRLLNKKNNVSAKEIAEWKKELASATERCGMAADPYFAPMLRSIFEPTPWYWRLLGWHRTHAYTSFCVLGIPVWRERCRRGAVQRQLLGIPVDTVKD